MASFWLEFNQNGRTQEFTFDDPSVTIGRDRSSDFVLDHPTVSRQHALIRREGRGRFILRVLSRGGLTAVDGQQVQGEVSLHHGAKINLGQLAFRFCSDEAPRKQTGHPPRQTSAPGVSGAQAGHQQARQQANSGGFGQSAGGLGQSAGGFGQSAGGFGQSAGGFGQSAGGFGQSAGGLGQSANASGGFGAAPSGSGAGSGFGPPAPQQKPNEGPDESNDGPDIVSWDEIASSAEAMQEQGPENRAKTIFERMEEGQKKQEETRPALVIVAGVMIAGLLGYTFFGGAGGGAPDAGAEAVVESQELEVEVQCIGQADCLDKAASAYKVGREKIAKADAAISNRFMGYRAMLEAEQYLAEAGVEEPPAEMKDLASQKEAVESSLKKTFKDYQVQYHHARSIDDYAKMALALQSIQAYFPDKDAPEHRWARKGIRRMKQDRIYPQNF